MKSVYSQLCQWNGGIMNKLFYPALFHEAEEGGFWVSFPDIPLHRQFLLFPARELHSPVPGLRQLPLREFSDISGRSALLKDGKLREQEQEK